MLPVLYSFVIGSSLILSTQSLPSHRSLDPALFAVVLEDLHDRSAFSHLPIVLDTRVYLGGCTPYCESPSGEFHSPEVLDELDSRHAVAAACAADETAPGCHPRSERVWIRLGPVMELGTDAKVKVVPDTTGVALDALLEAIPDTDAVAADLAIDAVITTPCVERLGAGPCRFPDTVAYRYFLQSAADGSFRVITRWPTGAI